MRRVDALVFRRVTYELMKSSWCPLASDPTEPFAEAIAAAEKYVASRTLKQIDWNAELLRRSLLEELGKTVLPLKA